MEGYELNRAQKLHDAARRSDQTDIMDTLLTAQKGRVCRAAVLQLRSKGFWLSRVGIVWCMGQM